MRLIVFSTPWRFQSLLPAAGKTLQLGDWEIVCNPTEPDIWNTDSKSRFGPKYTQAVHEFKPDFVLAVCNACSEVQFDRMDKPRSYGTKYISWSTDSYRHTKRCVTSDLHLTSISDATMGKTDHWAPLFHEWPEQPIPLILREFSIGIRCRSYAVDGHRREKWLKALQQACPDIRVSHVSLPANEYMQDVRHFRFGLNVGVYQDSLPNFRNFELGAAGVMPICDDTNKDRLSALFDGNIRLFHNPSEIPELLKQPYNPVNVQNYYNEYHCLRARLRGIFRDFFDLRFP